MKEINIFPQISLLERYLISQLITPLLFSIVIVTVVAESIGISFEQFRFLMEEKLSFDVLIYLHILKLPEFIIYSLPIAILMATIFTYQKLSENSEIIALQNCGLSLYRLVYPAVMIGLLLTILMLILNEVVVPPANYKAAITLEKHLNISRENLRSHDIFYIQISKNNTDDLVTKSKYLKYLFYAKELTKRKMKSVILLIRDNERLKMIINSKFAECYGEEYCYFYDGAKTIINADGSYGKNIKFDKIPLYLPKISLQFKADREKLDHREMTLHQAYQQLSILETAGDHQNFLKLQVHIQKRFTSAISSTVFAFLGSAIGINLKTRTKYNSFALTLGIILLYDIFQLITGILVVSQNILYAWVWLPNIVGTSIAGYLLIKKNSLSLI
ncbi:LptF/LptG family permease [Dolichospermum sp. LEGE 00240]|uniref:LptF/LptG family permease n=1 Tax=Dolichospermum sp. LEGE 00240 TaxID=1828603 RepID=UPI00187FFDD4|nr:LptF/LptG family permease [Dolichospermum sp. LEGE 00240]MDK2408950.1 LptF/LptG family permease [Aphanizomenon sp. 202]MDK2459877.1 LptF/LptG family permease [Aphanizomenon sp. PH219]MDM3846849.1 LptF/LptG family permease [Aphanizomenon gracile PMC638.10]MDM3848443.1 LptF/LptG family permease [Aphanizomenon gracile PMC627.10]MDM3860640.1 LptF/LptG family permease [Aphanizomenon gracile PMC644.10]